MAPDEPVDYTDLHNRPIGHYSERTVRSQGKAIERLRRQDGSRGRNSAKQSFAKRRSSGLRLRDTKQLILMPETGAGGKAV